MPKGPLRSASGHRPLINQLSGVLRQRSVHPFYTTIVADRASGNFNAPGEAVCSFVVS